MGHDHSQHDAAHYGEPHHGDRRLLLAVALNLILTLVEIAGGLISGSLALLADALHNFGDCGSLLIALVARRWSRLAADHHSTFGYRRSEVVAALINLTIVMVVAFYLLSEAVGRLLAPQPVDGLMVIGVASVALVVNFSTAMLLWAMSRRNINIRAAFLHNATDAVSSLGVIAAGGIATAWNFPLADTLATCLIAAYVVWQSQGLLRRAVSILMNRAPAGIATAEVARAIVSIPLVRGVHHVHLWQLDEHDVSLEAHVVIDPENIRQLESLKHAIKTELAGQFGIEHSTLEFELDGHTACADCTPDDIVARH